MLPNELLFNLLFFQVFIERPEGEAQTEKMREDVVIDYLSRYPSAIITYLQHLVFTKKLQVGTR